jgi:lipid II:glycine glycyltransferase (peptidoglycan interpeptide bridge formation enzyme)
VTTQQTVAGAVTVTVAAAPGVERLREWDDLVRSRPGADVAQLSGWARTRAAVGIDALYVLADRDGELVGGAQVLVRRLPLVGRAGYVSYGPLVRPSVGDAGPVQEALTEALADLTRGPLRAVFVQPALDDRTTPAALRRRGFRPSDAGVAPAATTRVDLSQDEADLRRNLSKRLRTWTNRWEKVGVTVRLGEEADLPLLSTLLAATGEHQGFEAFDVDYFAAMHRELAPDGNLVVFVGEAAGQPVAMMAATACGGVLTSRLVGFDRASEAASLQVPAAISWTALRWAKEHGFDWYDLGGLHESTMQRYDSGEPFDFHTLHGPDQYKLRFGGEQYRYPQAMELIGSPVLRLGYDLARRSGAGRALVGRVKRLARTGALPRPGRRPGPSDRSSS